MSLEAILFTAEIGALIYLGSVIIWAVKKVENAEYSLKEDVIRRNERKRIHDEIKKQIDFGSLPGNGFDEIAERNGLTIAVNMIREMGI